MSRVNYLEAKSLFGHIDGYLATCCLNLPEGECSLTIEVYPWWDHPNYRRAREEGKRWRWGLPDEAVRSIVVHPLLCYRLRLLKPLDLLPKLAVLFRKRLHLPFKRCPRDKPSSHLMHEAPDRWQIGRHANRIAFCALEGLTQTLER